MQRNLPVILLSLLSAGSLGAAAYLWSHQQALAGENASLRARSLTSYQGKPGGATKPSAPSAKPDATESSAPAAEERPPGGTPEEDAKRKEFESRMTAQRQQESDTRQLAKLNLLKTRLQLTPEQEQMATAALQKARDLRKTVRDGFQPGQPPDFAKMRGFLFSGRSISTGSAIGYSTFEIGNILNGKRGAHGLQAPGKQRPFKVRT